MEIKKVGKCLAPKESDIVYVLKLQRRAAKGPVKWGKFAISEMTRLNAYSLITAEYELILNGKSTLSATDRQEVKNWIDNLISVKNENAGAGN